MNIRKIRLNKEETADIIKITKKNILTIQENNNLNNIIKNNILKEFKNVIYLAKQGFYLDHSRDV